MDFMDDIKTGSFLNGTKEADVFTIPTKGVSKVTVNADDGDDVIHVLGGKSHKLYGEAGNDVITVAAGSGIIIDTGAGKDVINVQGGTVSTLNLTEGNNTVVLNTENVKGGTVTKLFGGSGTDTLQINKGTVTTFYGNNGKATVTVAGGTLKTALFGTDKDELTVSAGTVTKTDMGNGNDIVSVSGGKITNLILNNGKNIVDITGGTVTKITGGLGEDIITVGMNAFGGSAILTTLTTAKGTIGVEKLTVDGGTVKTATFGLGDDSLTVNSGFVTTADLGDGHDIVAINGGTVKTLKLNAGNNEVTLNGGTINTLNGGSGNNTIVANAGTITKYVGSKGVDNLTLGNINALTAKTGNGNDSITITGGNGHTVYGDAGNDSITVSGGQNITVRGGKGSDRYKITNLETNTTYNIVNSDFAKGDVDTLNLDNYASTDFDYAVDAKKNMTLTYKNNGARIVINGWGKNSMTITFSDGEKSVDVVDANIIKEFAIVPTKSAKGTEFKDIFKVALGTKVKSTISNYSKHDVLDLTAFKDYDVHLQTYLNDLRIILSQNGKEVGYVSLKGYNLATSKLESVLLFDKVTSGGLEHKIIAESAGIYDLVPVSNTLKIADSGSFEIPEKLEGVTIGKKANAVELKGFNKDKYLEVFLCGDKLVAATSKQGNDGVIKIINAVTGDIISTITLKEYGNEAAVLLKGTNRESIELPVAYNETIYALDSSLDYIVAADKNNSFIIGTDHNDKLEIKGIAGSIALGLGNDYIHVIGGSSVTKLDMGSGENTLDMEGGKVDELRLGQGTNTVNVNSGEIYKLYGGAGQDNVNLLGNNSKVTIAGGVVDVVAVKRENPGMSTLTVQDGVVNKLDLGDGNSLVRYNGGTINELVGGNGATILHINTTNKVEADLGGGDDIIVVNTGVGHVLAGGVGNDMYKFTSLDSSSSYIIDQSTASTTDTDTVDLTYFNSSDFGYWLEGKDLVLKHKNGAQITISNWQDDATECLKFADKTITTKQEVYESLKLGKEISALESIQQLMSSLNSTKLNGFDALNEAVVECSFGRFGSLKELVNEFIDVTVANSSTDHDEANKFLAEACGVIMNNEDTGSITGADAGGSVVKTAESIVPEPEGMTVADFVYNAGQKGTFYDMAPYVSEKGGLLGYKTFSYVETDDLIYYWDDNMLNDRPISRETCEQIIGGIINAWSKASLDLVKESYGFDFADENCTMYNKTKGKGALQIYLDYRENSTVLAEVKYTTQPNFTEANITKETKEILSVNIAKYSEAMTDINGNNSQNEYLDRTIVHELTHASMCANINRFDLLPTFFVEGAAELVHGVDDVRRSSIYDLLNPTLYLTKGDKTYNQEEYLRLILSLDDADALYNTKTYGAGYLLLRYLGKQVADYSKETNSLASLNAASLSFADDSGIAITSASPLGLEEKQNLIVTSNV